MSSGFRSSCYWTDWNWANTENIRIGLVFAVLAQWKFLYCIDRFDHIKANKSKLINKIKYWLIAWLFVSHRVSDISAICMTRASLRNNRECRKNDGNAMVIGFRLQEENKSNESCGRILSSTYSASIIRYTSLLDISCARVCGRSSLFVWHGAIVWSSCTILICPVQTS